MLFVYKQILIFYFHSTIQDALTNNEYGADLVSNEKLLKANDDLLVEIENYDGEVNKYDAMIKVS